MNRTAEIIIKSIRNQVCGMRENIGEVTEEDLKPLYAAAKSQEVVHIVASELKRQGVLEQKNDICGIFYQQMFAAAMRYEMMKNELGKICDVLENAQIPHIPLKGAVIRKFYPQPWMRTSGDIDILIHKCDTERAVAVLVEKLKYENKGLAEHDVQLYSPDNIRTELHFDTIEERYFEKANGVLDEIWEYSTVADGKEYLYELKEEMFYFYHIAHMAKHFADGGCGIRFFLDLWLLNHSNDYIHEKRAKLLERGGFLVFEEKVRELSEIWFSGYDHTETSRKTERYVLQGGVFGNKESKTAAQQTGKNGNFKYIFSLFFPPYRTMVKSYPILRKYPYLMPCYYVYKWFCTIRDGKIKSSVKIVKKSTEIFKNQTDNVRELFEELGL